MRLIVAIALLGARAACAQRPADIAADSARAMIESAVRVDDVGGIAAARRYVERALATFEGDGLLLHYRGYALYREATARQARGQDVGALLDDADRTLERAGAARSIPETFALRASVIGMRIGKNPFAGMRLGPRASKEMDRAMALGPENPRVWLLSGQSAIFTPSRFGGGMERAQEKLERAVALFASDAPAAPLPSWGRAEAHYWLAQVYEKRGKIGDARAQLERALAIAPESAPARAMLQRLEGAR